MRPTSFLLLVIFGSLLCTTSQPVVAEELPKWSERKTNWKGYDQLHFKVAERPAFVTVPKTAAPGKPWVWRARFPGYHAEMDATLVENGFHVAYVDVAGLFGSPKAIEIGDALYAFATTKLGLAKKPALEGVSRGGLLVYNWATKHPENVACIYCDTPVCDFKSWPGGRGKGLGSEAAWKQCLQAYGFNEQQGLEYDANPVATVEAIAKAKIPILHIVSENDRVVPPAENTYLLKERFEQAGHSMDVISVATGTEKSNGHHFTHPEPDRVVQFIMKHASGATNDRTALLKQARRILFLGDSITFAGHYVAHFDTWLAQQGLEHPPIVINAGLPSETVSGLSEEGHAGGRFPRPDLFERLERVLNVAKPDLVFACYGINCGIYQPLDEQRFDRYQKGIERLKKEAEAIGAKVVFITPTTFDDQRAKKDFSYNKVLDQYAAWLISKREDGWSVIDLHTEMNTELSHRRKTNEDFTFQPDSVHPNSEGHWFMAGQLIRWFGDSEPAQAKGPDEVWDAEFAKLVAERMSVRRNAYVSAAGHKRPGVQAGLPLEAAEKRATTLSEQIDELSTAK